MQLSRQSRVVVALIALLGVLFTQLVVAAYICPSMQLEIDSLAMSSAAHDHDNMPGCEDEDAKQPLQCHKQVGTQSLDKPELPHVSAFIAHILFTAIGNTNALQQYRAKSLRPTGLTRTTSPPLSIQNCCFRI
jgi:hypothetical protein